MPFPLRLSILLLLTVTAFGSPVALAQDDAETITEIEVGFEGTYRVGKWTPVWVTYQADPAAANARVTVTTPDGDGVAASYSAISAPVASSDGKTARQLVYVQFGRSPTWLSVAVHHADKLLAKRTYPAGSFPAPRPISREVILSLGADLGVEAATELSRRRGDDAYLACRQTNTELLPDQWFGYDSIDTIVLSTSDPTYLATWSDAQIEALTKWIAHGGRLVVSGGSEPLPERWQSLYPGTPGETQLLRRTTALEVYAGAAQRLDLVRTGGVEIPVTVFSQYEGRPLLIDQAAGRNVPLFVLHPRGFGVILFAAIDFSADPIKSWGDRPRLLLRLIRLGDESESAPSDSQLSGGRVTHIGYRDMSGQLRSALEDFRFGGVSLIPFSWVAVLIVIYIVLIGPVDYFFLRRVVRRMEYTWITFPLVAVALAGVAVLLTGFYKGDRFVVRQLAVIDHDLASGSQRQMLWAHAYSPANDQYDMTLTGDTNRLLCWHGLPGTALGGMQSPAAAASEEVFYNYVPTVDDTRRLAIEPAAVPINVWSTKSLFGYAWSATDEAATEQALAQTSLVETNDQRLSGQLINSTDFELTECQLLYDRWAYAIRGTVAPDERIHLADEAEPRDLEWKMTRRVVGEDNKPISTPWNPSELDVPRIVEVMMFHRATGGQGYTGLGHRHLQVLDWSRQLRMGRAVLVGRVKQESGEGGQGAGVGSRGSGVRLVVDNEQKQPERDGDWTYVRLMIPVKKR